MTDTGLTEDITSAPEAPAQRAGTGRRHARMLPSATLTAVVILALWVGWTERDEYWYSAEYGLGYAFGVMGFSMMVLLLTYPLRKYWKPMHRFLPVRYWFQMHMFLGVIGPVLILFHANFRLGSLNSNVALFCMLLVACSGLIGRYVYSRIHRGLYGEAIAYQDLARELDAHEAQEAEDTSLLRADLDHDQHSVIKLLRHRRTITHALSHGGDHDRRLFVLARMANHRIYEKLFSLWHVFHLPFFFMMCITAIVHIVVVHMY